MGSLRAVAVLASLVGCETSGVQVDVLPPPEGVAAPDQIRLFLGKGDEREGAIGPEGFAIGEQRYGWIWTRDPRDAGDVIATSGEAVSFGFVAENDQTELGAIIAVGYTAGTPTSAGSLFHAKTGVGNVQVFELQLHPAFDPRLPENRDKDVQLEIWGKEPGDDSCIHLNNTHPERDMRDPHDTAFIVTGGDQDCDGYGDKEADLECTAEVHDGTRLPSADELACAFPTNVAGGSWCVLGGPRCTDGPMQGDTTCLPAAFCAPISVCTKCDLLTGAMEQACIRDPFRHAGSLGPTMFGIECHISTQQGSDPGAPRTLCNTPIVMQRPLDTIAMPKCSNPLIASSEQPPSQRLDVFGMTFDVETDPASCSFKLTADGVVSLLWPSGTITGSVTVDVESRRSVALPIRLILDPPEAVCNTQQARCYTVGELFDRPPLACIAAPPPR